MQSPLSYKNHFGKTFHLAYPVMLSQLGHIMVGIVDSIMVGQLGPTELAASSFANNFMAVFMMFGIGVTYGITPMVAQADGKQDQSKLVRLLRHGIILSLIVGVFLVLLMFSLSTLFPYMRQPDEVIEIGRPYFFIIASSLFPMLVFQGFRQFSEGMSVTKPTMFITILANIVNVVLNYLLIYGKLGFPELGLNGAGWATLISRVVMAIGMFWFVRNYSKFKEFRAGFLLNQFKADFFKPMLKIGIPTGGQFVFEVGAFAMSAIMMGWLGTIPLAAHQIAISLVSLSYMMASGISAASTVRVGNHLGQEDYPNLKRAGNTSFLMVLVFMAICSAIYILFNGFFPTIYVDEPEVIGIASSLIVIAGLFQLSDGVQVVGLGCLRGMSDVRVPTIITFVSYWGLAIPASYLFGFVLDFGAPGIWYGLLIGLTVAAILLYIRFNKLSNKKILSA